HPAKNPVSPLMLAGGWVPDDTHQIDFDKLPRLPGLHTVVNDVRHQMGVNQHNYRDYYDGKYWIMWRDGPGIEDRVGQRVNFATSTDGVLWSEPRHVSRNPPGAARAGQRGLR